MLTAEYKELQFCITSLQQLGTHLKKSTYLHVHAEPAAFPSYL